MLYQQGDVLLQTVNEVPEDAKIVDPQSRGVVLAEGEVTGHAHVMNPKSATMFATKTDRFLVTKKASVVTHEEHGNITVPKGVSKIGIVKEYDHFAEEARNVKD